MSIAIPTFAPGAIRTYSDLLAYVRDRMDDADYPQKAFDWALRMAEAHFGSELSSMAMETAAVLPISGQYAKLPDDFLALRSIAFEGAPQSPLQQRGTMGGQFINSGGGTPVDYVITAQGIRLSPVPAAGSVSIVYSRTIPELSEAQLSNWLLITRPDLYASGVLHYLSERDGDHAAAAAHLNKVALMIDSLNGAAMRARYGNGPLIPNGIRQVGSIRA